MISSFHRSRASSSPLAVDDTLSSSPLAVDDTLSSSPLAVDDVTSRVRLFETTSRRAHWCALATAHPLPALDLAIDRYTKARASSSSFFGTRTTSGSLCSPPRSGVERFATHFGEGQTLASRHGTALLHTTTFGSSSATFGSPPSGFGRSHDDLRVVTTTFGSSPDGTACRSRSDQARGTARPRPSGLRSSERRLSGLRDSGRKAPALRRTFGVRRLPHGEGIAGRRPLPSVRLAVTLSDGGG